jgi:amidohydrolase
LTLVSADSPLIARALARVDDLTTELLELRRDLHAHPELSWQEERTTALVAKRLDEAGLVVRPLGTTGVLVDIGENAGPVVALRADLDALAVDDGTTDPGRSTIDGVAHACGHDVHAAGLVGAGLALQQIAADLPGRVRLVFQPAEEIMPGGALMAVRAGALDGVSRIFGLHCDPGVDVGRLGLREGPLTGAADSLDVRLSGRGGHT